MVYEHFFRIGCFEFDDPGNPLRRDSCLRFRRLREPEYRRVPLVSNCRMVQIVPMGEVAQEKGDLATLRPGLSLAVDGQLPSQFSGVN